MRLLHLVRHAKVVPDPERAPTEWGLAPGAEASLSDLLQRFDRSRLRRVLSSRLPKAVETARIIADDLDLPLELRDGLEEHHRSKEDYIAGEGAFRDVLAEFFRRPEETVFGQERAADALERFAGAIQVLMDESRHDELVISHGTVISLLLAQGGNGSPMDLWTSLKSPDHIAIGWPGLRRAAVCGGVRPRPRPNPARRKASWWP